jgi:2-haloacid dehalogenase
MQSTNPATRLNRFDVLTFDCYGTLIDWEAGITAGLRSILEPRLLAPPEEELLEAYARAESTLEAGTYLPYREVLARAADEVCQALGVQPSPAELDAFAGSVASWPAFPDSADALARLKERFRLGVITNCDDDLFAASARRLGVDFDWIVTAQQVRSYKPALRPFEVALTRIGLPRERVLHVAQSLFHDHVPARSLGLATAWIDRRHGRGGAGATPRAQVRTDLVHPDLATFAQAALA